MGALARTCCQTGNHASPHERVRSLEVVMYMGLKKPIGLDRVEKAPPIAGFRDAVLGVDLQPHPLDREYVDCCPSLRK